MKEHWGRTILRFTNHCRMKMILSVICAIISVFGGLVPYYGVYNIVIVLTGAAPTISQITPWVLICLAGYVVAAVFHMISTVLSHISAYTILNNIRLKISQKLMGAPLGLVINEKIGRLKNLIIDRVEVIELPIAHMIPEGFSNLLLVIGALVYLVIIDYRMALAAVVTAPVSFLITGLALRGYTRKYQDYMKASDHVNSVIVEYSEGIEVIKMFNQSDRSYEKYEQAVLGFKKYVFNWMKSILAPLNASLALMPATLLGLVPVGIVLYQNGGLTPAEFVLCVILALGMVPPLMHLLKLVNDFKMVQFAVDEASEFLNVDQLRSAEKPVKLENYNIALKNVGFSYDQEKEVLQDVSIDFKQHSYCALVGPSGSGKSTIAKIIVRFWDAVSGEITLGGVNIQDIPLKQLSRNISFVTQDIFLFDCSLRENIRMGNPSATDEEVIEAAKKARCHDFIEALEKGYDTTAGEAGNRLSGGEKQRISIARAILKDAPVLILDEATTYTDPENELEIQRSVSELTRNKTLIVVAHRLSTIKDADKIILVDNGRVKDTGSHDELLRSSELYQKMWEMHLRSKNWAVNVKRGEDLV